MTNDNKPPMFGPSAVIDPATYQPRAGKSFFMDVTGTVIANAPQGFSFIFDSKDNDHTFVVGTTGNGMSALFDPSRQYAEGGHVRVLEAVLGCPHCHAKPKLTMLTDGAARIECEEHPEIRVLLTEQSVEDAVTSWNDSDEWERIGTSQTNATMLSTRPTYNLNA